MDSLGRYVIYFFVSVVFTSFNVATHQYWLAVVFAFVALFWLMVINKEA